MATEWAFALLVMGIICGVLLLAMAMLGGLDLGVDVDTDVDADAGVGPNPLGLPTILAVLSLFGLVGYAVTVSYGDIMLGVGVGVASGILAGSLLYLGLRYMFLSQEASSDLKLEEFIGKSGEVSVPISRDGAGQVVLISAVRGRTPVKATAKEEIHTGEMVTVVGVAGGGVAVERIRKDEKKR
jgi:membrane protein implicated in regulation of membrane protease activity